MVPAIVILPTCHLEPEQHTITVGSVGAIADGAVMMFDCKVVPLQDKRAILHQLLILHAAVTPRQLSRRRYHRLLASTSVTQMRGWGAWLPP